MRSANTTPTSSSLGNCEREEDAVIYTVTDITPEKVLVDGNHPFAGERLWFKCAVTDVRDATEEELTHGHVHGDYGVHPH